MTKTLAMRRALAVVAATLLLVLVSPGGVVDAKGRSQGLTGTWFISLPGGVTGFYTYHHDGTVTGTVSTIFGAPPQPPGPVTKGGADHGVWRRKGRGFEARVYRMFFDANTGDPVNIAEVLLSFHLDHGRQSTSGSWKAALWFCPDAFSCPDPNTTPPDLPDITPPPPLNTFTQTRVQAP
jgi:hypothetical protein